MIKKTLIVLLLLVLVSSALGPLTASAQAPGPQPQGLGSIFTDTAGCAAGNFLGGFMINLVISGLNKLRGLLPTNIRKYFLLEDEVPIHNLKDWTKQHVLDLIARCSARAILNDMTGRMIGAVRTSGRNGGPAFVRDWRKFLAFGQYRGENIFRSMLQATTLCPHYSNQLKSTYKALYQPSLGQTSTRFGNLDPYSVRARCTMPSGWTLANYQLNFVANGGWGALTQLAEPQNNFYGSLLMSSGELNTQRSQSQTEDIIEAITGTGMTSRRGDNQATKANRRGTCSNNSTVSCTNSSTCVALSDDPGTGKVCIIPRDDCLIQGPNTQCLVYNDILTPGRVFGDSVSAVINNEMGWITGIHEMEELMSNLTYLLMDRILNLSKPEVNRGEGYPGEAYPPFTGDPDIDPNLLPDPAPPPPPPPPGPICSDLFCDAAAGEDSTTCPADCPPPPPSVTVWSSANFSGTWESFAYNDPDLRGNLVGDNNIESIQVPGGISVELCAGFDYGPPCETFTADDLDLSNNTVGANTTSSIRLSGGGSNPECSDGLDNDSDTLIDFPNDPGCLNANDNDEITYVVSLCQGYNNGLPCEWFSADDPDLSDNPGTHPIPAPVPVGDNAVSSFVAGGITYGRLVVEFCILPNYGGCVPVTIGFCFDFRTCGPIPDNTLSSIRVQQQ
ncbi:MAG: hypothetical protein Q8R55_01365 [Candidatus Taylorbacteria bacterium]|nr:hypothetical protein [Candidatus Taylorbacteria bacterium]